MKRAGGQGALSQFYQTKRARPLHDGQGIHSTKQAVKNLKNSSKNKINAIFQDSTAFELPNENIGSKTSAIPEPRPATKKASLNQDESSKSEVLSSSLVVKNSLPNNVKNLFCRDVTSVMETATDKFQTLSKVEETTGDNLEHEVNINLEKTVNSLKDVNDDLRKISEARNRSIKINLSELNEAALKEKRMTLLHTISTLVYILPSSQEMNAEEAEEIPVSEDEWHGASDSEAEEEIPVVVTALDLSKDLEVLVYSIKGVNDELRACLSAPENAENVKKTNDLKSERLRLLGRMRGVAHESHLLEAPEERARSANISTDLVVIVNSIKGVNDELRSCRSAPQCADTTLRARSLKGQRLQLLNKMRAVTQEAHLQEMEKKLAPEIVTSAELSRNLEAIVYTIKSVNDDLRECCFAPHLPEHSAMIALRIQSLKAARLRLLSRMQAITKEAVSLRLSEAPSTPEPEERFRPFGSDAMDIARNSLVEFVSSVVGKLTKMKPNGGSVTAADVAKVLQ
mmetsp:Transcript_11833/g.16034  ORF Transcript_11833/g.16034 Transcript_11833/m.16034 type:complete len:513 (-) Transcript_11833:36-1574(-)|eukprot:CAMPEP_0196581240 /NCGR_PEP_ID=MMETSP1081-20130531/33105_1 /TAXON_ID=36882 /ORGANISM="Pyramimonas amylifera, Strain CCMP720" /LENGTH=512 /DNA_ID=CAMNT_0041901389 /DNA_START=109 /DNA_END=1647 /DNA_ORIENTATION=-